MRRLLVCACLLLAGAAHAQGAPSGGTLPSMTISGKATPDPVEKSYRAMVRGMDLFEREKARAPKAALRFKVLPRKQDVSLSNLDLYVLGRTLEIPVSPTAHREAETAKAHRG